ncbi:MAG TPA: S8 family serine peptidase, partial [Thermoanaerobaculia bacterium]|nr:S8 family serine peptidase [Thermoanaerobaculia bacterium]
ALMKKDPALKAEVSERYQLTPHFGLAGVPGICKYKPFEAGEHCGVINLERYAVIKPTVVAILDSGIAPKDGRFHYWRTQQEYDQVANLENQQDLYSDDVIGVNFVAGGGFPKDDVDVAHAKNHGTHVAGIAACRLGADDLKKSVNARIGLMVLKVAKSDASLDPGAIAEAVAYARFHNAHIMNMSFEGPKALFVKIRMEEAKKEVLFVVAAGNGTDQSGRDLDTTKPEIYPAVFSKDLPNVISVAAHDAKPEIACFSNRGGNTIDIAAPGTAIESTIIGTIGSASGTSQATPFVTFAAALLHARGMKWPQDIKRRLMDSTDFYPSMVKMVKSEGILNVTKALAYDEDIVRVRNEAEPLIGTIVNPPPITIPNIAKTIPLKSVRKLITGYPTGTTGMTKIISDLEGVSPSVVDKIALPPITIIVNGVKRVVLASDILEIIPRMQLTP